MELLIIAIAAPIVGVLLLISAFKKPANTVTVPTQTETVYAPVLRYPYNASSYEGEYIQVGRAKYYS